MTPDDARIQHGDGTIQDRARDLFMEVGSHYAGRQKAEFTLYENGSDVHALYVLATDRARAVHLECYADMSSPEELHLKARLVDYRRMAAAVSSRGVAALDDSSMLHRVLNSFGIGIKIPYDTAVLQAMLEESVPELR